MVDRLLSESLEVAFLELVVPGSRQTILVDAALLRRSPVVRKLVVQEGGQARLELHDSSVVAAISALLRRPNDVCELLGFVEALDFLCMDLSPDEAMTMAGPCLSEALAAISPTSRENTDADRFETRRLEVAPGVHVGYDPGVVDRRAEETTTRLTMRPAGKSEELLRLAAWLQAFSSSQIFVSQLATLLRSAGRALLLNLASTPEACLYVLENAARLPCSRPDLLFVVQNAVRRLYLCEKAWTKDAGPAAWVPWHVVLNLRDAYASGVVDLDCLLPLRRGPLVTLRFLPDALHRRAFRGQTVKTPQLTREEAIASRLQAMVPWLPEVLAGGAGRFLSGSLLTKVLVADLPCRAGDADLFVEERDGLCDCVAAVARAMGAFVAACGFELEMKTMSETRVRFVTRGNGERVEGPAFAADVYWHPLRRVGTYHLPQVRAAFDGSRLLVTVSCAVALVSRMNVDVCPVRLRHKFLQIAAKKYADGFNLLLNYSEQRRLLELLSEVAPALLVKRRGATLQGLMQDPGDVRAVLQPMRESAAAASKFSSA